MRKLGTIDFEVLQLAMNENGTFDETHLENSKLKRHGVGKILDTLASLKDKKFISMNQNGSFTITDLAKEILWSSKIPTWAKILRLLQIKSCDLQQIIETIDNSEENVFNELGVFYLKKVCRIFYTYDIFSGTGRSYYRKANGVIPIINLRRNWFGTHSFNCI